MKRYESFFALAIGVFLGYCMGSRTVQVIAPPPPPLVQMEYIETPSVSAFQDPHDDPKWTSFRNAFAKQHTHCMVTGCRDNPKGDGSPLSGA